MNQAENDDSSGLGAQTCSGSYIGMVVLISTILGLLIKTHDSESRGQEEAAYATTE